jgi:integrase
LYQHLNTTGRALNTIRRAIGRARQFFNVAKRRGMIEENPFDGVSASVGSNSERVRYITREDIQRVIDACPDHDWKLIFALCRFGGLRCPCEVLLLKWEDVRWHIDPTEERIHVQSPKTARQGKASRIIPMFRELRPYLLEAFEVAADGAVYVVSRYRRPDANLGTQAKRIIRRAGLKPWPKPFQNLRSTRETELLDSNPIQVVCSWIGNSQPVAMKHYLQVTDEHFKRAIQMGEPGEAKLVRNPVQEPPATACNEKNSHNQQDDATPDSVELCEQVPLVSTCCQSDRMPCAGLEPATR